MSPPGAAMSALRQAPEISRSCRGHELCQAGLGIHYPLRPGPGSGYRRTMPIKSATHPSSLLDALRRYAPKRAAKLRGATTLQPIEKLAAVHPDLGALWTAVNGAGEIIVPRASELDSTMDLLSVSEAATALRALRKTDAFPEGRVVFATDGAGNFLAIDVAGRIRDWDHETRKESAVAPSLAALLARTIKAMDHQELFGGPEGPSDAASARILNKLDEWLARKSVDIFKLFGNDIFRVVLRDRAQALVLLDAVENKLKGAPKDLRPFAKPYLTKVSEYRKRAKKK